MSMRLASTCAVVSGVLGLAAFQPVALGQFCATHLERVDGPVGPWIQFMGAGDFNGDGRADLVVCELGTRIFVYFGRADGTFAAPVITDTGEQFRANRVKLFDLTGDGIPDMLCDQIGSDNLTRARFRIGHADGTFSPGPNLEMSAFSAVGDLNGDGRPDLAGFRFTSQGATTELRVLVNQGGGNFATVSVTGTSFTQAGNVLMGDFNADGRPDLLVLTGFTPTLTQVLLQAPAAQPGFVGAFVAQPSKPIAGNTGAAPLPRLIDVNGDGIPDLVGAGGPSFFLSFNPGLPTGGFGPRVDVDDVSATLADVQNTLVVADVNGDGLPDLLRHMFDPLGRAPSQVLVKYNLGGGRYSAASGADASPPNHDTQILTRGGVAVGDFNGDGIVDIIADQTAGSDGTQAATYTLLRGTAPAPITIASGPALVRTRVGQTVRLSVQASAGDTLLGYRWLRNEVPLTPGSLSGRVSGVNTPTLTIEAAETADSGSYSVEIMAPCSSRRASTFVDCTSGCDVRDLNGDGAVDPDDLSDYITLFFSGCP